MRNLFQSVAYAFLYLFHPRVIWMVLIPPVISLLLVGGIGWSLWGPLSEFIQSNVHLAGFVSKVTEGWISWSPEDMEWLSIGLMVALGLMVGIPLILMISLTLTSVLAQPVILKLLAQEYPQLEKRGVSLSASLKNALKWTVIYVFLWVLTLPLWIVPGMAFFVPILLNTFLHYKVFTYDSLSEHASKEEIQSLMDTRKEIFLGLGLVCSLLLMIPFFFIVAPLFASLSFVRLSFMELTEHRSQA
ncbi:MAG: EI24 domain-containing protein [Pseudobdellovibrionaceae bacterium]